MHKRIYEKHSFSAEIRKEIQKLCEMDNYHGVFQCIQTWIEILVIVLIMIKINSWLIQFMMYPIAAVIIGSRQRSLAQLLHQSAHLTLAKNKILNFILGSVTSGWLVVQSWTGYYNSHIKGHHTYFGDPVKDPDYAAMIKEGLFEEPMTKKKVQTFLYSIPTPTTTFRYIQYLVKHRIFSNGEKRVETFVRFLYYCLIFACALYFGCMKLLLIYWLVPLLTTANWVGALVEFLEHYPLITKMPNVDIYMSRNRMCGLLGDVLLGTHNEKYHLVHHLFVKIPNWNLIKAHKILMTDEKYADLHENGPNGFSQTMDEIYSFLD